MRIVLDLFLLGFLFSLSESQSTDPWDRVPEILSRIKAPVFPNRECNILSYGAIASPNINDVVATTVVLEANINAFHDAIEDCHVNGGGTVTVPQGTFITAAITLKSNISLNVSPGAIIRFTRDKTRYPNVYTRWEGIELWNYSPFIYAYETENIAITGSGIVDGNCDCENWWPWKGYWPDEHRMCWNPNGTNQADDRALLFQMAEDEVPVSQRVFGEGHYLRPMFIQPYKSKNVLIEGITILNSPMWIVHPVLCENVIIRNINITSLGPNSDGVDPESCKDVHITGVLFNNGDDDIAIKSGRNADGRRVNVPSENIVIQNCSMADGHGGITLGSCCSGGMKNIFAENCFLSSPNLDTAIRVKNNALRGGLLEGFYLRNIKVGEVRKQVIEVDFYYEEGPNSTFIPILKDFVIENLEVTDGAPYSLYIQGYEGHPSTSYIQYTLRNASFTGIKNNPHFNVKNVDEQETTDVKVNGDLWNINSSSTLKANCFGLIAIYSIYSYITSF